MTVADAPAGVASRVVWSFTVGALAMLTFHQAAVGLFHAAGMFPVPPFELQPTGPLQVPKVANGAFWSGLWGIVFLMVALPRMKRAMPGWAAGLVFGFLVPVAVLFFVVAPLQGQPIAYAQSWGSMLRIALAHAFWGFGMVVIWQGMSDCVRCQAETMVGEHPVPPNFLSEVQRLSPIGIRSQTRVLVDRGSDTEQGSGWQPSPSGDDGQSGQVP